MTNIDLCIIGAGPAGLAAAISAYENGVENIMILERDTEAGGILNQCIHNGFGLHYFSEELTGPEYADRFIQKLCKTKIILKTDTMVLKITPEHVIYASNPTDGILELHAKAIILAMGCRERPRGAISIPGDRPSGVFTAGTAQRYINIEGKMIGKRVVILGSGDIGLIMARRMTLEGAKVLACVELMPYSNGLTRNIVQCLNDFDIPLYLSHTVTKINGTKRLNSVEISEVDENRQPIPGTGQLIECDTLLLSVGLIPENELSTCISHDMRTGGLIVDQNMQTTSCGIFACGNVVHVHDLVDFVTQESIRAGKNAANYILGNTKACTDFIEIKNSNNVSYTVPQRVVKNITCENITIFYRVRTPIKRAKVILSSYGKELYTKMRTNMTPGEMETLDIPYSVFTNSEHIIDVSVEPV